ncbi:MAG: hypothetical protein LBI81_02720 [Puniceicoccales bacterium]|jgi:phosphoribosyl-AMP cyclohydrolase|nr:hypothetical protein [Puniceicoccales bacterium]
MPEFEENFTASAESVTGEDIPFEDNVIVKIENEDAASSARKNQARYALKRGRLPQLSRSAGVSNGHVPEVKAVDVTCDAIGFRAEQKNPPRNHAVKKSTELVEHHSPNSSSPRPKRPEAGGGEAKPKRFIPPKREKEEALESSARGEQSACKLGKFSCFAKKLLNFLGIGRRKNDSCSDGENFRSRPHKHHSEARGGFRKYRYNKK